MTIDTHNPQLKNQLEQLLLTAELEECTDPVMVAFPEDLDAYDIDAIKTFLSAPRKRIYLFTIPEQPETSKFLQLFAVRAFTDHQAAQFRNRKQKGQVGAYKLINEENFQHPGIEIQRSIDVHGAKTVSQQTAIRHAQMMKPTVSWAFEKIKQSEILDQSIFKQIMMQTEAYGVHQIHKLVCDLVQNNRHAFTDGLVLENLPKGLYIDDSRVKNLCYTNTPITLPTSLAPRLFAPDQLVEIVLPHITHMRSLLTGVEEEICLALMSPDLQQQQQALITLIPHCTQLFTQLPVEDTLWMTPLLTKLFILGGENHLKLFVEYAAHALQKGVNLSFLRNSFAQRCFLEIESIKNLKKLSSLLPEQITWWNRLTELHLLNPIHIFDFNSFYLGYTDEFLSAIHDFGLTLPSPCHLNHKGHFLITLNRILLVLKNAANPVDQFQELCTLDWSFDGAYNAMLHANPQFKQVSIEMQNTETLFQFNKTTFHKYLRDILLPTEMHIMGLPGLENEVKQGLFRILGLNWKSTFSLDRIRAQFAKIQEKASDHFELYSQWLLMTHTLCCDKEANMGQWIAGIDCFIEELQSDYDTDEGIKLFSLPEQRRILNALNQAILENQHFDAKTLVHIFKKFTTYLTINFEQKQTLMDYFCSCLLNEGFPLLERLDQSLSKRDDKLKPEKEKLFFEFMQMMHRDRIDIHNKGFYPHYFHMLASLKFNFIEEFYSPSFVDFWSKKLTPWDITIRTCFMQAFSNLNIRVSNLPTPAEIEQGLKKLLDECSLKSEFEKMGQSTFISWLQRSVIKPYLPQCVFGEAGIPKVNELLVDTILKIIRSRQNLVDAPSLLLSVNEIKKPKITAQLEPLKLLLQELDVFFSLWEKTPKPEFKDILKQLETLESYVTNMLEQELQFQGKNKIKVLLDCIIEGKTEVSNLILKAELLAGHLYLKSYIRDYEHYFKGYGLNSEIVMDWFKKFNKYHTLSHIFQDEMVAALKKELTYVLLKLNSGDQKLDEDIIQSSQIFDSAAIASKALAKYEIHITQILKAVDQLISLKNYSPACFTQVIDLLKKLNPIDFSTKQILLAGIPQHQLIEYLELILSELSRYPEASLEEKVRALKEVPHVFAMNLEEDLRKDFFKMSFKHNLKSSNPFPLAALNNFNSLPIPENVRDTITQPLIKHLARLPSESVEIISMLFKEIGGHLVKKPVDSALIIHMIERIPLSEENINELSNLETILEQLKQINVPQEQYEKLAQLLVQATGNSKDKFLTLEQLKTFINFLVQNPGSQELIASLYQALPLPKIETVLKVIAPDSGISLAEYCAQYDKNPLAQPGKSRDLQNHFNLNRIPKALKEIEDLVHELKLNTEDQVKLARQLTYINVLGYLDAQGHDDFKSLKKLTACTRIELKNKAHELFQQLRTPNDLDELQHEQCLLEFLAVIREIYFRTTGLFPNSTQMLVLLLSQQYPSHNLLMRICTGEGKSLITPLLAVLEYTRGPVDICTANTMLLERDYENNGEPFFNFLDIPSAVIHSKSPAEKYQAQGINFSTVEDLALFRLAAQEQHKTHLLYLNAPRSLILDECDDALLDQNTAYQLVTQEPEQNQKALWIYPMVLTFINSATFKNIGNNAWDEEEDIDQLRKYLLHQIQVNEQNDANKVNFVTGSSRAQLKKWLIACCKAMHMQENKHYLLKSCISEEGVHYTSICPVLKSFPKTGIIGEGVHQALQARLNQRIDPGTQVIASQSAIGLVKEYQHQGRLIGISGTPGELFELKELAGIFNIQAINIPPHAGDNRHKHDVIITRNPLRARILLKNAILEASKNKHQGDIQPILIIAEDFVEARAIETYLRANLPANTYNLQLVTGQENNLVHDKKIQQAGRSNTITIGTAQLSRGTDIIPENHPRGLFVIQTFPDTNRLTTQIAGRSARNGNFGEWLPIYQVKQPKEHWFRKLIYNLSSQKTKNKLNMGEIAQRQQNLKSTALAERRFNHQAQRVQLLIQQQIAAWEELLLEVKPNNKEQLLTWRQTVLTEISILQSDFSIDLNKENIQKYTDAACVVWKEYLKEFWGKMAQHEQVHMSSLQNIKYQYLQTLELQEELKVQTALHQEQHLWRKINQNTQNHQVSMTVKDKAGAYLHYQPDAPLQKESAQQQLPYLIGNLCVTLKTLIKNHSNSLSKKFTTVLDLFPTQQQQEIIRTLKSGKKLDTLVESHVQDFLKTANDEQTQILLTRVKALFLEQDPLDKQLITQCKMNDLLISFNKIWQNMGAPEDQELISLEQLYTQNKLIHVARYLQKQLSWCNQFSLYGLFQSRAEQHAAQEILTRVDALLANPSAQNTQETYVLLQKYSHSLPKGWRPWVRTQEILTTALEAVDSMPELPHCPLDFRDQVHDKAVADQKIHSLKQILSVLDSHKKLINNPLWSHFKNKINQLCDSDEPYAILELQEHLKRWSNYPACISLQKPFKQLQSALELFSASSTKQDCIQNLLRDKEKNLARLMQLEHNQIKLRQVHDGMDSFIELQIEHPERIPHFFGYRSAWLARMPQDHQAHLNELLAKLSQLKEEIKFEVLLDFKNKYTWDSIPDSLSQNLPEPLSQYYKNYLQNTDAEKLWQAEQPLKTSIKEATIKHDKIVNKLNKIYTKKAIIADNKQKSSFIGTLKSIGAQISIPKEEKQKKLKDNLEKIKTFLTAKDAELNKYLEEQNARIENSLQMCNDELNKQLNRVAELEQKISEQKLLTATEHLERQKIRYQTRKFNTLGEFLAYEATLYKEEQNIPVIPVVQERVSSARFQPLSPRTAIKSL